MLFVRWEDVAGTHEKVLVRMGRDAQAGYPGACIHGSLVAEREVATQVATKSAGPGATTGPLLVRPLTSGPSRPWFPSEEFPSSAIWTSFGL